MSALLQRVSIAILMIALALTACGPVTPVPATSPEPAVVPTSDPSVEVEDYEQERQKIREEFYEWAAQVTAELDYVIVSDIYEQGEWDDCKMYLILGQLVVPPSEAFSVCLKHGYIEKQQDGYTLRGDTAAWPDPFVESSRTGKVYWNDNWSNYQWAPYFNAEKVDQAHVNYTDIQVYFDGASNWRNHAVMPSIFDSADDGVGLVSCNTHDHGYNFGGDAFYYEHYFVDPVEVIYDTGDGPLTAVMPGLGIIEFGGKSYRVPESCLDEESLGQLEDRSSWHPGIAENSSPWSISEILATSQLAEDIDPNIISATQSEFPKVTLEQVFFGDYVGLVEYDGSKYLVDMDEFVNIQYALEWDALADDRESLEKAIDDGDILLPIELTVLSAFGFWNCLVAFDLPALPVKTVAANTTELNYQHVDITVYHMCHEYDLVIFDDMYMWPVTDLEIEFEFDFDYDAKPNYISGYWHYEKGWESVHIYDTPRNPEKDEVAVGLLQKVAQLDGEWEGKPTLESAANTGPLEACMDLIWYKQWIYTGELAETVEATCGVAMDFMERYNAESVISEYDEWEVYASTLLPEVDPTTVIAMNSQSTHVPLSRYKYGQYIMYMSVSKETACLLYNGEYGLNLIFESDGWTKTECVPQGAFVFMLDYDFNYQATGKPWDAVKGTQVYQVFP